MVKIKVISRDANDYKRKTNTEIEKVYRSTNPKLHPFQKQKEYKRALNAVKLDKIFSKPFIGSLNQPTDCIRVMAKNHRSLSEFASGGFDGQLIIWDLPTRKPLFNIKTPHNMIKGLTYSNDSQDIITCGDDNMINFYNKANLYSQKNAFQTLHSTSILENTPDVFPREYRSITSYDANGFLESIDHSYNEKIFATSGETISIWNYERNTPLHQFKSCSDGYLRVKFNYVENNIILGTGYDRSITLFDLRTQNPLKQVTLRNKSACACWNPQEPFNFTVGNEDSNCYTFDMRNLDKIRMIHKDHILAVLDIDYSPTGKEFVTGSFDKTIRIFNNSEGYSRECYHDKRMQKVYSVMYSMDDKYVLSGSDDTNIRIWKAVANDSIKILNKREEDARNYSKKLIEKYQYMPEMRKIKNQKHLPKYIINKKKELRIRKEAKKRKFKNKELNSKPGTLEYNPERTDKIVNSGIVEK
jgi:WD repeat and SOF domain-containing protein 1